MIQLFRAGTIIDTCVRYLRAIFYIMFCWWDKHATALAHMPTKWDLYMMTAVFARHLITAKVYSVHDRIQAICWMCATGKVNQVSFQGPPEKGLV